MYEPQRCRHNIRCVAIRIWCVCVSFTQTLTKKQPDGTKKKSHTHTPPPNNNNKHVRFVTSMFVMFHIAHEFRHPPKRMWNGKGSDSS